MWKTWTGGSTAAAPISSPQAGGPGEISTPGGWHPTIVYLVVLLAVEFLAVGVLSRTVLK